MRLPCSISVGPVGRESLNGDTVPNPVVGRSVEVLAIVWGLFPADIVEQLGFPTTSSPKA